jgi:hypothetical protein
MAKFSSDNFVFAQLPYIIPEYAEVADSTTSYFTGNPAHIVFEKKVDDDAKDTGANQAAPTDVDSLADSEDLIDQRSSSF